MVDPTKHPSVSTGEVGESTTPEKTITQIVFEIHIRYGAKSRRLYGPTTKDECTTALADMGSIAEHAIARVEADFAGLYMDLMALNISEWAAAQGKPEK